MSTLGQQLRRARRSKDITQAELAVSLGMKPSGQQLVSRWERDTTVPSGRYLRLLIEHGLLTIEAGGEQDA